MDFFAAQDHAHRKTRWLVFWFILAVICIIVLVYLAVTLWLWLACQTPKMRAHLADPLLFWSGARSCWISLLVGGLIAAASLYKIRQIACHGGKLVAEQLGGRRIARGTGDPTEKRLLNVVDEMAIAAGIPAPVVFVLDDEGGLNAFAAGLSTKDSVVAVTRGLLEVMNRDELQGVIGHEISHIVNGDSRLNLKLIGVLYGIYVISLVGRSMMRARGRNGGAIILLGLALCAIGAIGVFFGRLIQAAVSREREYLADASAVQFTRNPDGLSGALGKLQSSGSRIRHPEAAAASHLFFGASCPSYGFLAALLATHPPLAERIYRLGGRWSLHLGQKEAFHAVDVGSVTESQSQILAANPSAAMPFAALDNGALPAADAAAAIPSARIAQAQSLLACLPEALRQQALGVAGATGIIGGLFFSPKADIRLQQEKDLPPASLPVARELYQWLAAQPEHGARYRLAWLGLVLPVLREGTEAERQEVLALAATLVRAEGRMSPSEFALFSLLYDTLLSPAARRANRGQLRLKQLDQDIASVLALITHAGHEDQKTAEAAYQAAMACSPARAALPYPAKITLSLNTVSRALANLALAAPPYRKKLLEACAVAIRYDGKITPVENELLRAFAQSLGCPAPLAEG
ncbi:MAG: M48 family metallopeptidase [Desulfobulbus sp.]|nr:M48 family metallopeptidase [Desulfobulbus sp.]